MASTTRRSEGLPADPAARGARVETATGGRPGVPVRWYVPRVLPGRRGASRDGHAGACAGGPVRVGARADRFALPRVDAHYLRRPGLLDRALKGRDAYLRMRHLGGGVRPRDRTTAKAEPVGARSSLPVRPAALANDRRGRSARSGFLRPGQDPRWRRQRPAFARSPRGDPDSSSAGSGRLENVRFRLHGRPTRRRRRCGRGSSRR